jgi:hypothetical protein
MALPESAFTSEVSEMRKLTTWNFKVIPLELAKPLRYAVQHFESFHVARMENEDSHVSAAMLPAIRETLGMVDSQADLSRMIGLTNLVLPAHDASQIAVLEMAIVEWAIELANVDSTAPIKVEAMTLVREWDKREWSETNSER